MKTSAAAVIFDLDGVLTDTAKYHFLAWQRIASELGIYFDSEINERLKGIDRRHSLEIILKNSGRSFSESEKVTISEQKNNYYKEMIASMGPEDLLPGAIELLEQLKRKNIKIGLASASKNACLVLEKLKITGFFDYIVAAETVKRGKPDPEIYLAAAAGVKMEPSGCIGIEDAVAGVKAIKAAGMYAVGVGEPSLLTGADEVIRDLTEFKLVLI